MVDVNVDFIFESEQPINADFQLEPDVTYTADIKLSEATRDHTKLYNRDRANQHPMGAITGLEDALSDEATARQNADITLQENITAENNRAVEVESQIINNLSTEVNRLDVEDARLNQKIDTETQRAKTIEAEISGNLLAEKTARENADKELSDKIDTVEDDLTEDIDSLATIVDNNYNTLDTRITNVADELGQQIEENVVALQQEDTALQNQINAHSQTLTSHDTRITNNANAIIQEATDRQTADDVLQDQIDTLSARGRFLSLWDATTGLAESAPQISPYIYKTGDYFIVDKVGEVNYRPTGTEYVIGQASTVVETEELATDDVYYFDGATWHLQINHGKTVSFANLAGSPDDNIALKTALDNKQPVGDYATNTALTQGLATKANDSDVVHKTGNETVGGIKEFTGTIKINNASSTTFGNIAQLGSGKVDFYTQDSNGWTNNYVELEPNGITTVRASTYVQLMGQQPASTNQHPTATTSTTDYHLATTGWVNNPSNSTNVVHRSGNETIAGDKTFSNPATFNSTTTFTTGVTNFNNGGYRMWRYRMATNNTYEDVSFYDNAGTFLGSFRVDNTGKAEFITFTSVNAPTPATSDNSTKIATTAFVKAQGYATTEMLDSKQDVITDLDDIRNNISTNTSNISYLDEKVRDIELFKFPNAVIIGEPTISNGQVSGFSASNYMQFPFILDLHNTPFQIDFAFTTGNNVTTQQNILDSEFGLALAIANGKGLMAISGNGTSWNIGSSVGTINILPNTTYYARLTWDGMQYKTLISTNGIDYTQDMYLVGTQRPYPRTIFIGGCSGSAIAHTPHPFFGSINMNKSYLSTRGQVIWQGMDDAGLATRADISLSNLDELGEARFNAKQDKLTAGENITIVNNVISSAGGNVDNKSITKNTDNQIQAVGVIEKNTGAVKYDWIGTLAEYNSQNVETLHPDWVCFITDDVSGGTSVYTKTETDSAISNALDNVYTKAETDAKLLPKQDVGTAVNYGNISNCITEIPQDIKLELNNGTLTLKAGSKVYDGNGLITTTSEDKPYPTAYYNGQVTLVWLTNLGSIATAFIGETVSSLPAATGSSKCVYNSTDKKCYCDFNSTWYESSFPLGLFTSTTSEFTSIDQIFNGFGYIGSTVFALPGVKGLIPNGRNEDGSLKNIEFTTTGVKTETKQGETSTATVQIDNIGDIQTPAGDTYREYPTLKSITKYDCDYYVEETNQMYFNQSKNYRFCVGSVTRSSGRITSLTPKTPFHAVDRNDSSWIAQQAMPSSKYIDLTLGASGSSYTAPANGWFNIRKFATGTQYLHMVNHTSHIADERQCPWSGSCAQPIVPAKKGDIIIIYYNTEGNTEYFRFIYAEGEN